MKSYPHPSLGMALDELQASVLETSTFFVVPGAARCLPALIMCARALAASPCNCLHKRWWRASQSKCARCEAINHLAQSLAEFIVTDDPPAASGANIAQWLTTRRHNCLALVRQTEGAERDSWFEALRKFDEAIQLCFGARRLLDALTAMTGFWAYGMDKAASAETMADDEVEIERLATLAADAEAIARPLIESYRGFEF